MSQCNCEAQWSGQDEARWLAAGAPSCSCKPSIWDEISNRDELEALYWRALPEIRRAAKEHGYAIGLHGSMRRDLDLIAVPWVEKYSTRDVLAEDIQMAACGFKMSKYEWEQKPNGRMATAFPICSVNYKEFGEIPLSLFHIDLSVVAI